MPLVVGLVGEPGSGKTTIFEVLQAAPGGAAYAPGPVGTRVRTVEVDDPRLAALVKVHRPKRRTPVTIRFVDFPGKGGKGEARIAALREVDAFLIVVRGYPMEKEALPDLEETVRGVREEWALYDLDVVENRLRRVRKEDRLRKRPEEEGALLERLKASLEEGRGIHSIDLSPEEEKSIRGFRFLTEKPVRVLINVGEGEDIQTPRADPSPIRVRGQVEKEIAELPEDERGPFLSEMGVGEPAWSSVPRMCLGAFDVVTFYTVVGEEVRAWTLQRGGTAREAAGRIHADMAKGFVRAEVLSFEDFAAEKGPPAEKRKGRIEGRNYIVQDGDILTIRFTP